MRMKSKIIIPTLIVISLLFILPAVKAFSIGISPAEKTIDLEENKEATVYFAVSQGASSESQTVVMSSDASWLSIDPQTFDLGPTEQKYVKVTIMPSSIGDYTAKIKALASIPGISVSMTADLNVHIVKSSDITETEKTAANDAMNDATTVITQASQSGANTTDAEAILARSMEEYDKGNYAYAKDLAQVAYTLATNEIGTKQEQAPLMFPVEVGLIFAVVWGCIGLAVTVYEFSKAFKKRSTKLMKPARGYPCPVCRKPMASNYEGAMVRGYVCPSCGHKEVIAK